MDRSKKMGTGHIPSLLVQFAVPSVFSLLLHAFYNIVDRIFIGRGVGPSGLAGVAMCFPALLLVFGLCLLFSSGTGSLVSIYLGQGRRDEAEKTLGTTIMAVTVIGGIVSVAGYVWYGNILSFFGVPPDIFPYAADYLKILFAGMVLFLYGFTLTFVIRAEGNPVYATFMMIVGTFINLVLDPLFIFVFSMGTSGAALATIISEAAVALMGILYITRKKGTIHIRRSHMRFDITALKRVAALGASPAIMDVVASIQIALLNGRLLVYGGNAAVAAMGVVFPIASMIMLFTFGMAAGMQPIIGYNHGAGNPGRVRETFLYACAVNFAVITLLVGVIMVFSRNIASLFLEGAPQLVALSSHAMTVFLCMAPFAVIHILGTRYFQSVGKGFTSVVVGLLRQLFVFVPVLFILSARYRLEGVWWSGPVTDIIAAILTSLFLVKEMRMLKRTQV